MTPGILSWYKERGFTHATFAGRKGWSSDRLFLHRTGWQKLDTIIMEREIL